MCVFFGTILFLLFIFFCRAESAKDSATRILSSNDPHLCHTTTPYKIIIIIIFKKVSLVHTLVAGAVMSSLR
jgi:hypothetical protein